MTEPKKIVIAEDDPDLQEIYRLVLDMRGYVVETASDGVEALLKTNQHKPHILLLDILMPKMDGREFLRNFDADQHPDLKIIVTSNLSDQTIINDMLSMGAHDYVLKSELTPDALIELVERTLAI